MASAIIKTKLRPISLILCTLGLVLILLSQTIAWCDLNAQTGIRGLANADIELNAKFYEARVEYEARASNIDTGGVGGILGGFIDVGGITGDGGNITIEPDTIYYLEGLGRFQDLVGVIYGTTKNADYWINPRTYNSNDTKITVNTHTELIPWWPEGIAQEITVTVELNETDNVKNVRINNVSIVLYADWDEDDREYQSLPKTVWMTEPGDYLYEVGDKKVYKHGVTLDRDWGDRIGIIAMVNLTMTDNNDETDHRQMMPFSTDTPPPEMVNIIPITQGQTLSIVLLVFAFPMTILGIILTIFAILLTIFQRRRRTHLMFSAALVEWFALIFFMIGANTLIGMIDFVKPEWFTWNVVGIMIPILAGALLFVAFLLNMIFAPKEKPEEEIKFDISGALAEGEAEEEGLECPECGAMLGPGETVCPSCGEEFEIEEVEEGEEESEEGEAEEESEEDEEMEEDEEEEGVDGEEPEEEPKVEKKKRKWRR